MPDPLDMTVFQRRVKVFDRDLWGDEFAHCLARITLGWGATEHMLYLVLQAIEPKKSSGWTALLFAPRQLARRKEIVRQEVTAAVQTSYPQFIDRLNTQLAKLQKIQDRRNLIVHGLWLKGTTDRSFRVQPLALKKGTKTIEDEVEIDHVFLSDLIQDMEFLEQSLAALGSEMLAHQWLRKHNKTK